MANAIVNKPYNKSRWFKTVLRLLIAVGLVCLIVGSVQYDEMYENAKNHVVQIVLLVLAVGTFLGLVVNNQLKRGFGSFEEFLEDETAQIAVVAFCALSLLFYFSPQIFQPRLSTVKFLVYDASASDRHRNYVGGMVFVRSSVKNTDDSAKTGREAPGLLFSHHSTLKVSIFAEDGEDAFNEQIPGDFTIGSTDTVLELPASRKQHLVKFLPNKSYSSLKTKRNDSNLDTLRKNITNWKPEEGGSIELAAGSYTLEATRATGMRRDSLTFVVPTNLTINIPPPLPKPPNLVQRTIRMIPPESSANISATVVQFTNQQTNRTTYASDGDKRTFDVGNYSINLARGDTISVGHGVYRCRPKRALIDIDKNTPAELRIELVFEEKIR